MFKKYKKKLILSSLLTLLPILFGLLLWNKLPDTMITHWGADGQADSGSSKAFAVFFLPALLLALQLLCLWVTEKTNNGNDQNPKVMNLIFFMIPVISLMSSSMIYAVALDRLWDVTLILPILMGLMFIVVGNYMPKCTRNTTIGIKSLWALNNDENWNATHRFAGKVWVAAGAISMLSAFLPMSVGYPVMFVALMGAGLGSTLYSYLYYRKQLKAGTAVPLKEIPRDDPVMKTRRMVWPIVIAIVIGCSILLFTGSIEYEFREDSLVLDATFGQPLEVRYDSVDTVEYRETDEPGLRTAGFSSLKLLLGNFENDEFGSYTRYTYCGSGACIVVTSEGRTLVFSGRDGAETQALYQELLHRIG